MIFERWDTGFDIKKLQQHLHDLVLPLEITTQSDAFGGWSVLSSDGTYQDGWHKGHLQIQKYLEGKIDKGDDRSNRKRPPGEYVYPTSICTGYLKEIIDFVREKGLSPSRARIIRLSAQTACVWHVDALPETYAVRLHVPILTNPGCFFETETERAHFPADGSSYFIHVNRKHRVVNEGVEHRYHLVMDVRDKVGLTKYHRFSETKS